MSVERVKRSQDSEEDSNIVSNSDESSNKIIIQKPLSTHQAAEEETPSAAGCKIEEDKSIEMASPFILSPDHSNTQEYNGEEIVPLMKTRGRSTTVKGK